MATNPTSELATLTRLLNTPGLTSLPVRVTVQGELQLEVNGPGPLDRIRVLLEGNVVNDLYAAVTDKGGQPSWLKNCIDLFEAVQNGWIVVAQVQPLSPDVVIAPQSTYIPSPPNPQIGDILVFNGSYWTGLSVGPNNYVLTSNGTGFLPSYQPTGGGGTPPGGPDKAIQYKNGTSFAGSPNLTWDNSLSLISINGDLVQTGTSFSVTVSNEATISGSERLVLDSDKIIAATTDIVFSGNIDATSGGAGATLNGPVLTDTSKTWTVNEFVGNYIQVVMVDGTVLDGVVLSNTVDEITVEQPWTAVGPVDSYEVPTASLRLRNVADPVLPHDVATKQWVESQVVTASGGPKITGQVTTGLSKGNVCFLSGVNTWSKASADSTLTAATTGGVFNDVSGTIELTGSVIDDLLCTTEGGLPSVGARLFLAKASDDGGTGEGKATAIAPSPPSGGEAMLQIVGICVDNTNYAASKTVKAVFQPSYPTILVG